ncbi:MAG: diphosphate--fructose-6-phosphate 1-phosphotransferase [Candidatus Marinimicrobia bacterium]|nr:diphosphate--fructose-6-phosphate 1-phosphotransferase [Candidatus Neomarinimicrobiota bacterium]
MKELSQLHKARTGYQPKLPSVFHNGPAVRIVKGGASESVADRDKIKALFPHTYGMPMIGFKAANKAEYKPLNLGVILSGGQAPGGHNVIAGLYDGLKACHPDSKLYGFLGGPSGLTDNEYRELDGDFIADFRNTGGFDMIASGRTKLDKTEQYEATAKNCKALEIEALIVIGGDDSNTNAAVLAEYFSQNDTGISVIGVPKTIDGDLKNEMIEASFGFDTATKVYTELIGNIQRDANSAKKYWHIIKLMGRSASHIALECALRTQPNYAIISEEVEDKKQTLHEIVDELTQVVVKRSNNNENFGTLIVPEGLIEFIPEMKALIAELNDMMAANKNEINTIKNSDTKRNYILDKLQGEAAVLYGSLPKQIAEQLIMERDPHGNVQVSLIDTDKLLVYMIEEQLAILKAEGKFKGKFKTHTHFFGYEGRCSFPSNFDADYTYTLGYTASLLAENKCTGYMSSVRNLKNAAENWIPGGVPMTQMMNMERRHGEDKPVIKKALVELNDLPFKTYVANRDKWAIETSYIYPGPIQYYGPAEVSEIKTITLELEHQ